jgi:DNA-binding PadR family transcriptional regulator
MQPAMTREITPEEEVKILYLLKKGFNALKNPIQFEITRILFYANRPLSFSEIKMNLKEECTSPVVSYCLRNLERAGIITNERKLDTTTGKARTSFYKLTDEGRRLFNFLIDIVRESKQSNIG